MKKEPKTGSKVAALFYNADLNDNLWRHGVVQERTKEHIRDRLYLIHFDDGLSLNLHKSSFMVIS